MKRILCCFFVCLTLAGCVGNQSVESELWAMDTYMSFQIWGQDAENGQKEVSALITQLEKTWSAVNPNSPLSALNRGENPGWGKDENAFLEAVDALETMTSGTFCPHLYSVSALWGFYDDVHRVPTEQEIQTALKESKYDLGGVLKGYAGKIATEVLTALDVQCAILNLGGNIQTLGTKSDGTSWKIGIQNPRGNDTVGVLSVEGTKAVITSGDYQRYFEHNGVRYHHILDPKTGYPADSDLASVTVIGDDGMLADALSTALFVMGSEESIAFWRENQTFQCVFILKNGEILATEGVQLSGCEFEVILGEE